MFGGRVVPRRIDGRELAGWIAGPLAFLLSSGLLVFVMRTV